MEGLPDPELEEGLARDEMFEMLYTDRSSFGVMEIRHRFGYHKPSNPAIAEMHQTLRGIFTDLGTIIDRMLPEGRAKSVAMTHLEDSCMWSNKAIAEMSPVVDE